MHRIGAGNAIFFSIAFLCISNAKFILFSSEKKAKYQTGASCQVDL